MAHELETGWEVVVVMGKVDGYGPKPKVHIDSETGALSGPVWFGLATGQGAV